MELDPQGINVCQVHPGVIASDFMSRAMFRGADSEKSRESLDQVLTSPLAQKPQEIAGEQR